MTCLSVVIPAYNAASHLGETLACLLAQSRTNFEVIVIDDGSTDGTAAVGRAFAAAHPAMAIRLIEQRNAGVSAARNRGIAEAQSDLIAFLDSDDLWAPDKVACQVALMEARPEVELSFTGFRMIDEQGEDTLERSVPPEGMLPMADLLVRNSIHTSTVVVRKSAIEAADGFDTSLRTYEDFDLWLKIAGRNDPCIYGIAQVLTDYRRHGTQATRDWWAMHEGWREVVGRAQRTHPQDWARVERRAWAFNLEYCASLAYNAGNIPEMRRIMREAWHRGGLVMLTRKDSVIMTGIFVASYLPRPFQILIGKAFVGLRRMKRSLGF